MPVRKGCIPEAPEGSHITHGGTLLEGAVTALPEDPPEAARADDVDPVLPGVLDLPPEAPPEVPPEAPLGAPPEAPLVDEAPPADPVAEPPAVVVGVV